jgi:hypothetical protein
VEMCRELTHRPGLALRPGGGFRGLSGRAHRRGSGIVAGLRCPRCEPLNCGVELFPGVDLGSATMETRTPRRAQGVKGTEKSWR